MLSGSCTLRTQMCTGCTRPHYNSDVAHTSSAFSIAKDADLCIVHLLFARRSSCFKRSISIQSKVIPFTTSIYMTDRINVDVSGALSTSTSMEATTTASGAGSAQAALPSTEEPWKFIDIHGGTRLFNACMLRVEESIPTSGGIFLADDSGRRRPRSTWTSLAAPNSPTAQGAWRKSWLGASP
jgi:hypothetical protein